MSEYRILVCGSRSWRDTETIRNALKAAAHGRHGVIVAHGDAAGADRTAGAIAHALNYTVRAYPAKWRNHDGSRNWNAGKERNIRMLEDFKPHIVLAFHQDSSPGTAHTIHHAQERNIPVHTYAPRTAAPDPGRPHPHPPRHPGPPIGLSVACIIQGAVPNNIAELHGALTIELFPRDDRPA